MSSILVALTMAIADSAILIIVYMYLFFQEKKKYLRTWALGWFFLFLRFFFEIWLLYYDTEVLKFSVQISNLLSVLMILYGTLIFLDKKTPKWFGYVIVLNFIWLPMAYTMNVSHYQQVLPSFLLSSIIYFWTGLAFLRTIDTTGIAKHITGATFMLWGLHKANYTFVKPIPEAAQWGYLVTATFEIIVALGIMFVHFEKAKQMERLSKEELSKQHKKFEVTLKSIGDGVITTNVKGVVDFINPIAEEITGYFEGEAVGKHISQIFQKINENTGEPAKIPIETVIEKGVVKGLANHTALIRKDGSIVSIADSAAPIKNNAGEIVGVVMVFRDVTKERDMQKSREQLAFIVEHSREAIYSLDTDYRIRNWNLGAEKIFGYKAEEIIGESAYILIPKELHKEVDEYISTALREKRPVYYETVRLRKDKSKVDLMISISPIIDSYNNNLGISIIAHDISDKVRSREMLRRYKMLSDRATDIILFIRYSDGQIIEANQAAVKAYGYDIEELLKLKINDLRVDPNIEDVRAKMKRALKGIRFETIHRRKDGSTFPVEVNSIGGILENQQVLLSICRDITERKSFEEQLKYISSHDYLTGLYNRRTLDEKLTELEKTPPYPLAIIMCDIDGLKMINDTFGHEAGDQFIKAAAEIFIKVMRKEDFIARTSGDEFIILMPFTGKYSAEKAINNIRKNIEDFKDHGLPIPLNVSIGYAIVENENLTLKEAQSIAEKNMYHEKLHHGRSKKGSIIRTLIKMLEARDIITQGHSDRTEKLAVKLSEYMGLGQRQIDDIRLLAIFHDIGKVGVPDNILFKKGTLTDDERLKMQRHTEIGHRIAISSPELAHIADWILLHHEWWDGNGNPLRLKGEEIPEECRILAVVDAYDAMTKSRPYRSAMTHEEAVAEIKRCSGTQFDPYVVEKFLEVI
ncbi:MAG TPA: PAS domain S-box protein [Thermoanaerobacterales bacterium]|nr:PAS domain S-box protein [Thermoanaerobacterales bacterium]